MQNVRNLQPSNSDQRENTMNLTKSEARLFVYSIIFREKKNVRKNSFNTITYSSVTTNAPLRLERCGAAGHATAYIEWSAI